MRYERRRDAELVELAKDGSAPAFAVLVHRHAPAVLAATADAEDPQLAARDVFVRAMRELPERDPSQPVGPWLTELAGPPAPWANVVEPDPAVVDELWRQLDRRWPDGRRPRRSGRLLRRVAVVAAALALGVAVPAAVLTVDPVDEAEVTELRAQPVDDPTSAVPEPDEDEPSTAPAFEFPEVEDAPLAPLPEDVGPGAELRQQPRLIPGPATAPGAPDEQP